MKSGFGKLTLANQEYYEGSFKEGCKHGEGKYIWNKTKETYFGNFNFDKREGLGMYYWADGGYFKGEWRADRMNGYGRLVKDGLDVLGEFYADHFTREVEEQ